MLQLTRVVFSVLAMISSLALFVMSYLSVGWGTVIGGRYGAVFVVLGTPLYFLSLAIAIRSTIRPLVATICGLGVILGLGIIIVLLESLMEPGRKWFPFFVILILAANSAIFVRVMKSRKGSNSP